VPWPPLKGADNLGSDPTTVEITGLGLHGFVIHITGIHLAGVNGDVVGNAAKSLGRRLGIAPGRVGGLPLAYLNREIGSNAFPFTEGAARGRLEILQLHILWGKVIHRRMAGF
jgi:hypothetical protein